MTSGFLTPEEVIAKIGGNVDMIINEDGLVAVGYIPFETKQ